MKKRLRKKKHLGEFREYGVQICIVFHNQKDGWVADDWVSYRFVEFLESLNLCIGGGENEKRFMGFISRNRGSVTIDETYKISEWLKNNPEVKTYAIGPLVDAWHCPSAESDRIYDEVKTICLGESTKN